MGRMKDQLFDMEEEFWSIAEGMIGGCECYEEFVQEMADHSHLVPLITDEMEFNSMLSDCWYDYWKEYNDEGSH